MRNAVTKSVIRKCRSFSPLCDLTVLTRLTEQTLFNAMVVFAVNNCRCKPGHGILVNCRSSQEKTLESHRGVKHMFASDGGQNGAKHACCPNGLLLYKQRCCLYKKCKFCQFIDLLTVTATTV